MSVHNNINMTMYSETSKDILGPASLFYTKLGGFPFSEVKLY